VSGTLNKKSSPDVKLALTIAVGPTGLLPGALSYLPRFLAPAAGPMVTVACATVGVAETGGAEVLGKDFA
jgi:hypothetical protein